jgi:hypothetical protein
MPEQEPSRFAWIYDVVFLIAFVALAIAACAVAWRYVTGVPF